MTNKKEFQNKLNELKKVVADSPDNAKKIQLVNVVNGISGLVESSLHDDGTTKKELEEFVNSIMTENFATTTARGAFARPVTPRGDGQAAICCVGNKVEE